MGLHQVCGDETMRSIHIPKQSDRVVDAGAPVTELVFYHDGFVSRLPSTRCFKINPHRCLPVKSFFELLCFVSVSYQHLNVDALGVTSTHIDQIIKFDCRSQRFDVLFI